MDQRIIKIATLANIRQYDIEHTKQYIDNAPHIKHASLREFDASLVVQAVDSIKLLGRVPRVLDLGAGEGSVTLPFLELGAKVVAIDISSRQLDELKKKCESYEDMLEVRCQDLNSTFYNNTDKYDIIVINSFLHDFPDYSGLIKDAITTLSPGGVFFTFQDPLRYDSLSIFESLFDKTSYFFWRIFKRDLLGGLRRRLRRSRGIYLADSIHDNAECHITRNGVDQTAIKKYRTDNKFDCKIISYFSTQSSLFQPIGTLLGVKNYFAVFAQNHNY